MFPLLNAFTVLLGVAFVTYVILILVPFLRYPKTTPGDPAASNGTSSSRAGTRRR